MKRNQARRRGRIIVSVLFLVLLCVFLYAGYREQRGKKLPATAVTETVAEGFPEYEGEPHLILQDNLPAFSASDLTTQTFLKFGKLDPLGRCGAAYACLSKDMMPKEDRQGHLSVTPSGWHSVKYPGLIEDLFLYNRCHLIAHALAGVDDNPQNLITGTRYLNVDGMLPFEIQVAKYLDRTDHHVLYRVTPLFYEDDLVARGVEMEAYSVEDEGEGICFHVYVFNVQPGVLIDYRTGESSTEP